MTDKHTKQRLTGFLSLPFLRDISIIAFMAILVWKLLNSDIKIDLSAFAFTDLLALILALFSVWLSVAFYFKATDASNQFYDNTYRFTKETAEMLGRIEAGFGEKLEHLNAGYSGIREQFDRFSSQGQITSAEVMREEDQVKQKEQELRAVIEELAIKAKLAEDDRTALFADLDQKNNELEQARMDLLQLQEASHQASTENRKRRNFILNNIYKELQNIREEKNSIKNISLPMRDIFKVFLARISNERIQELRSLQIIDENNRLHPVVEMNLRRRMMNPPTNIL